MAWVSTVPNAHVFSTKDSYRNHYYWCEHFLDTYGKDHWCVVVDIDELFFYPNIESVSLKDLCRFLENTNATAIHSLFLDVYAEQSIAQTPYKQGDNPLNTLCFFDAQYQEIPYWFMDRYKATPYFFSVFTGGMRERVFGNDPPPILSKVPLFKNIGGTYLSQGMHAINDATLSQLQGVVFHTKFLSDFVNKVEEECQREEHYNKAMRYKIYQKKLKTAPDIHLYYEGSTKFKDPNQLVELGLMKTTFEFEELAQLTFLDGSK